MSNAILYKRYIITMVFSQIVKQSEQERTFDTFWPIVLYHVSFFIFITTIGLNIIFGIIVDTFSELRDLKARNLLININSRTSYLNHFKCLNTGRKYGCRYIWTAMAPF